ncbi:MAG: sodium:calcium antiporter [Ardenticatenaceae bacterium]|nr:sodium:calcium antiporter [Ardenticatenaceae bacterium]
MFLNIVIIIASIVALAYGATFIVDSAARMARHFGVSELIIGLTIVAVGTSAPEFAVTIKAAVSGQADISVSNIVGSNIFNLGFILGGVVAVRAITTTPKIVYRDGGMLAGATLVLLFFMRDLQLQPWEGGVLLVLLFAYLLYLYTQRDVDLEEIPDGDFRWRDVPLFALGIGMVVIGGDYLVESATAVARILGMSDWVIGVTIVAAGTSAPELATSLVGVLRGHSDISIGNLIGSDLFNMLGVLGLAGVIQSQPMIIDSAGFTSLAVLSGMVIFVVILMRVGWKLNRWEGVMLILINLLRWIFDFASK